jgi:hypothetical protein
VRGEVHQTLDVVRGKLPPAFRILISRGQPISLRLRFGGPHPSWEKGAICRQSVATCAMLVPGPCRLSWSEQPREYHHVSHQE